MTTHAPKKSARRLAAALLVGMGGPVLVVGTLPAVGQAEESPPTGGSPAGRALTTGVFTSYSDQETFFPGAATVPPSTWVPLATGGFENNGVGFARAAFGYNPYEAAPGAVNALTPAGTPQLPFEQLRNRAEASVEGEAPQARDASFAPGAGLPVGSVRAGLEEDGPAAVSDVVGTAFAPGSGVVVDSITSRTRVSRAGGQAVSTASTLLEGVTVAGALTFESIRVEASSAADGGPGQGAATVHVNGAAVNGTPVAITDQGVVAAENKVPIPAGSVTDALNEAGLQFVAPGRSSAKPTGTNSVAEARGPSFRLVTSDRREAELVLGLASTASVLFDVNHEPAPALGTDGEDGGTAPDPDPADTGGAPFALDTVASAPGPARAPADPGVPRSLGAPSAGPGPSMPMDLWSLPDPATAGEPAALESPAPMSDEEAATAPVADVRPAARASVVGLVSAAATSRVNALYAVVAVAGIALLLAAVGVPTGDRWGGGG